MYRARPLWPTQCPGSHLGWNTRSLLSLGLAQARGISGVSTGFWGGGNIRSPKSAISLHILTTTNNDPGGILCIFVSFLGILSIHKPRLHIVLLQRFRTSSGEDAADWLLVMAC